MQRGAVMTFDSHKAVSFVYTNWEGKVATRHVIPMHMTFSEVEWHNGPQWLLFAFDLDRKVYRHFAMKDIQTGTWKPYEEAVSTEVQSHLFG
jgi:predicted DNA-binding transcriptional regulator YafY